MYLCNLALLERLEGCPTCVALGGVLEVVGEVYEEVESGLLLNLIHAHSVGGVACAGVGLVLKPEADSLCRGYGRAAFVHLEHYFVEVVGHGHLLGVVLGGGVGDGLAATDGLERGTCHDVDLFATGDGLECTLEGAPDAVIEGVMNLRCRVCDIECLQLHSLVAVTRSVGYEVTTRVSCSVVVGGVGGISEVHLIARGEVGVVAPIVGP